MAESGGCGVRGEHPVDLPAMRLHNRIFDAYGWQGIGCYHVSRTSTGARPKAPPPRFRPPASVLDASDPRLAAGLRSDDLACSRSDILGPESRPHCVLDGVASMRRFLLMSLSVTA